MERKVLHVLLVLVSVLIVLAATEGRWWHFGPQQMIATIQVPEDRMTRDQLDLFATVAPRRIVLSWADEIFIREENQRAQYHVDGQSVLVTVDAQINPQLWIMGMESAYNDPLLPRAILPNVTLPDGDPGNYVVAQRELKALLVAVSDNSIAGYKSLQNVDEYPHVLPAVFSGQTVGPLLIKLGSMGTMQYTISPVDPIHIRH